MQGGQSPPSIPEIDFRAKMIVALCWGSRPGGCQDAMEAVDEVLEMFDDGGTPIAIEVRVDALPALGDCDMVVYPIQILEIDTSPLPVHFTGQPPTNATRRR